jgi:RNA-binding protein PNO1
VSLTRFEDNEDEFLLDAPDAVTAEGEIFAAQEPIGDGETMAIDEEGRPRFAPAKDIVRAPLPGILEACGH